MAHEYVEDARRTRAVKEIRRGARVNQAYVVGNLLSAIIACAGLLLNNPAIVIGAMVISPLMDPIVTLALSLVRGDAPLGCRSLMAEAAGIVLVVLVGALIGWWQHDTLVTDAMLSQAHPGPLDLVVGLAGGAAAVYASFSSRATTSVVGVAIATSLVPPLVMAGMMLARGETALAVGALVMFLANFVAIQFAASAVMLAFHVRPQPGAASGLRAELRRHLVSIVALLALGLVLGENFRRQTEEAVFEDRSRRALRAALLPEHAALAGLEVEYADSGPKLRAVVLTPSPLTPKQTAALYRRLPEAPSGRADLTVRSVVTRDVTPLGYVNLADISAGGAPGEAQMPRLPELNP
jgi:uncharacterized hydrophobic protein (TIGR00271 family)